MATGTRVFREAIGPQGVGFLSLRFLGSGVQGFWFRV